MDDQIIVDIEVKSDEIVKAEKRFDELTKSIIKLTKDIKDARDNNKKYTKVLAELDKQLDAGTLSTESHAKQTALLKAEIDKNNKEIAKNTVELSKQKGERTANIKLINSESNSRDQLRQKVALLTKEYNSINTSTKEGKERSEELAKELKQLNEQLEEGSLAAGSYKDTIGNYPKLNQAALVSLNDLGDGMEAVGGSSARAVGGVKSLGQSFKVLLANPVVPVLAAIVAGLAALGEAFKKSESGVRTMQKFTAALDGTMSVLRGEMDKLGKATEEAFKKGEDGTSGFWKALKENVVYRLQSVIELFKAAGDGLKALWDGNTEAIEEASKKAKEALIGIVTGQTTQQLKDLEDYFNGLKNKAAEATNEFNKLNAMQLATRKAARGLEIGIANTRAELDKLTESAGDDTQSLEKQREAAIKAGKVAAQLAEQEKVLAGKRLALARQNVIANKNNAEIIQDLLDEQAEAQVNYTEKVSQAAITQQKIAIELHKIERDKFEQNLDILIDVGDKIKTEREKQIQDESLSLEKRNKLLNVARVALEANFDAIKKEYELYGVTAQQINEVINASDAEQANEKLKALGLNEIANNRLREIILERRQAEIDFNDLEKNLQDEEIARKQAANEKIKEINQDNILSQIEDAKLLEEKLIEFELRRREILLSDETLLEEERQAIILESEQKIQGIKDKFREEEKEKKIEEWEDLKEFLFEQFEEINDIVADFSGQQARILGLLANNIANVYDSIIKANEEKFEKSIDYIKEISDEAASALISVTNGLFDAFTEKRNEDLKQIESARAKELELAQGNADAQQAINVKYDQLAADLKRKQFNADKAKALVDIAIQTAVAVVKSLPNVALSFTVGSLGAVQAGIVASKKAPKFAKGVNDIVSIGGSHASGNDVDVWGYSGNQSQYFGKVEKGEAMPVIRKSAISDYLIAKLNGQFSPSRNKGFYQEGTPDVTQAPAQNNEQFVNQLVAAMSNMKIVAKIEDITKEAGKKIQIVDNSKV